MNNPFTGLGVALVTPFDNNGDVDYKTLSDIVEYLIENKVDFLCVLGTTAETPTLTMSERSNIVKAVVKQVKGRIPLMVGCSNNCTSALAEQLRSFDYKGIDGILSSVPYYNKPSQEGIYQHFKAVSHVSQSPIILYNVPGRTGMNMTAQTTLRIAHDFNNVIAIKEASGNIEQIKEILSEKPAGFAIISGDDSLALDIIKNGGVGVISVVGNAIPETFGNLVHYAMAGMYTEAESIQLSLADAYGLLFKEGNPCGVKDLMASRNMLKNILRLPLVPVSAELHNSITSQYAPFEK